jgi:hypothetical protein
MQNLCRTLLPSRGREKGKAFMQRFRETHYEGRGAHPATQNSNPQLNYPGYQEIVIFPGRSVFQDRVQRQAVPDLVLPEDVP